MNIIKLILSLLILSVAALAEARDPHQVALFRKDNPCPATGHTTGACPGWVVDHIKPLCFDGVDAPSNMTWQSRAVSFKKDAFEREACALLKKCGTK